MKFISFLFKALLLIFLILFSIANQDNITINLFFKHLAIELPVFLLVIGVLIFGAVFGMLSQSSEKWKLRREIRKLKSSLSQSSIDYTKLKNLAISDDIPSKHVNKGIENSSVKKQIR